MIKISLDSNALSALIEKDPAFELELKRAVIANIVDRHVKGSNEMIKAALIEATKEALPDVKFALREYVSSISYPGWNRTQVILSDQVRRALIAAVDKEVSDTWENIRKSQMDVVNQRMKDMEKHISERVDKEMEKYEDAEVQRRVMEKVKQAMSKLNLS